MVDNWIKAYKSYKWVVDLSKFQDGNDYHNSFNYLVTPHNLINFENLFRYEINNSNDFSFIRAGEVCFWKNFGAFQNRDKITRKLLMHLSMRECWDNFTSTLIILSNTPQYENFQNFTKSCKQPYGFATPITFLAFFKPTIFPMVDRHIAKWWNKNSPTFGYLDFRKFSCSDGTISKTENNWYAYIDWMRFCNNIASTLKKKYQLTWRPRDVEMAVWQAQKNNLSLEVP